MSITIVGLGPGDPAQLTREAWEVLEAAQEVYLRTRRHPTVPHLPDHLVLHSFDHLYEEAEDFGELYTTIAAEVLALGRRPEGVIYAVPGHPLVGEASVSRILTGAAEAHLSVRIVAGLSFLEPVLTALRLDPLEGLQLCDAVELAARYHPPLNPDVPALVAQLYDRHLAADVKLTLMNQYPADHPVTLVLAAGTSQERLVSCPLYELDRREEVDHLTTLYVPPLPVPSSFEGFQDTVAHLRAPDGCPWDREQTHQSLRSGLLEEVYEVVDALDREDVAALREELGDLLLQVVMHSQIAVEAGEFSMAEVIAGVDAKIKRRHPHVWGERAVSGVEEVLRNWEALKQAEKASAGQPSSVLDGVPKALPALTMAYTYGRRAARVGFDWTQVDGVVDKIREEIEEVATAPDPESRARELGDLLFAVVNWARWLDVDPEAALREANARFARRFRWVEARVRELGLDMKAMDLDELEALWQQAKRADGRAEAEQ